jgi:hypothetical protein
LLKISQAALLAAMLGLPGLYSIGAVPALAQHVTNEATQGNDANAAPDADNSANSEAATPDASSDAAAPSPDMSASSDAAPADAGTTTTSGITTTLSIPTITAVGSSMDEAALRDALSGGFMAHVDEIAKLTATSISIPEIDVTVNGTGDTPSTTMIAYKDVALSNVQGGIAQSASVGSLETTSPEGSFKFGKLSAASLDFGALLSFYSLMPAGDASSPMKALYKDFSFDGGTFTGPQTSCTFGKVTAPEFDARPLKISFTQLMNATKGMKDADTPSPEAIKTLVSFMADVFQAFKSEPVNVDGLSCSGADESGKAFEFTIGGITMDGYAPGTYPALEIKNLKIVGNGDTVTLADAKLKTIDLSQPIAAIEAQGDGITADWLQANYRKLIPAFGGFSFSGFAVNGPDPQAPGSTIDAKIASFDLTLSDYLNGVPTKISSSSSGIEAPLPAESTDDTVKMLRAIGLTKVNLGYEFSVAWDKATQTIAVDKLSVTGADLGSVAVAISIGNAAEQLFDNDFNVAEAAALGVSLKSVKVDVTDAGFADKFVPTLAAEQKVDAATFRQKIAGTAEAVVLQVLGATDTSKALADAVGSFVTGAAKSLSVSIVAKDPAGLPVPLLMQAGNDPTVLASAVDVTGSAH